MAGQIKQSPIPERWHLQYAQLKRYEVQNPSFEIGRKILEELGTAEAKITALEAQLVEANNVRTQFSEDNMGLRSQIASLNRDLKIAVEVERHRMELIDRLTILEALNAKVQEQRDMFRAAMLSHREEAGELQAKLAALETQENATLVAQLARIAALEAERENLTAIILELEQTPHSLQAKLCAMEAEREQFLKQGAANSAGRAFAQENRELRAKVERLTRALRHYGEHDEGCIWFNSNKYCNCGLGDLLGIYATDRRSIAD